MLSSVHCCTCWGSEYIRCVDAARYTSSSSGALKSAETSARLQSWRMVPRGGQDTGAAGGGTGDGREGGAAPPRGAGAAIPQPPDLSGWQPVPPRGASAPQFSGGRGGSAPYHPPDEAAPSSSYGLQRASTSGAVGEASAVPQLAMSPLSVRRASLRAGGADSLVAARAREAPPLPDAGWRLAGVG